jgi:hypothetical protein
MMLDAGLAVRSALLAILLTASSAASAEADGPDHFRVTGVAAGSTLTLRAEPRGDAAALARIPADAGCLRNQGCQGGLSFEEFSTLSATEREQRLRANPRWCKVEYRGRSGWVAGKHLAEAACGETTVKGQLKGREGYDHVVHGRAGQTLTLRLSARHPQAAFNLLPPRSELAMRAGESARYQTILPADGDYVVRIYLMRAAARRNERSDFSLQVALTGAALKPIPAAQDALIRGTPFHASASIACVPFLKTVPETCEAFVTRYVGDRAATVEVRSRNGTPRRILFDKGAPVASDSPDPMNNQRMGELNRVGFGADERHDIPDVLVSGG